MPILDMDPGQSPEAPGVLVFYEQGKDPTTGVRLTSGGKVLAPGGTEVTGDQEVSGDLLVGGDAVVTGGLTVDGYTGLGAGQFDAQMTLWSGDKDVLRIGTAGGGIAIKEGAGATSGVATLAAGAATVATDKVAADSRIQLTAQSLGTVTVPQALAVTSRTAGTSFTIGSADATDTSDVAWIIVSPVPEA